MKIFDKKDIPWNKNNLLVENATTLNFPYIKASQIVSALGKMICTQKNSWAPKRTAWRNGAGAISAELAPMSGYNRIKDNLIEEKLCYLEEDLNKYLIS